MDQFGEQEHFVTVLSNNSTLIYPDNVLSAFTNILNRPLILPGKWIVGLTEVCLNRNSSNSLQTKKKSSNLSDEVIKGDLVDGGDKDDNQCTQIYLYTDVIKPRHIGNRYSRCLRVFLKKNLEQATIGFDQIEYFPVQTNMIGEISVLMADLTGERINFNRSYIPTMCTFHFKKV